MQTAWNEGKIKRENSYSIASCGDCINTYTDVESFMNGNFLMNCGAIDNYQPVSPICIKSHGWPSRL